MYGSEESYTLGGRALPAFSQPILSTGASSEDLILRIPSRTFSQLAGGLPVSTEMNLSLFTLTCKKDI